MHKVVAGRGSSRLESKGKEQGQLHPVDVQERQGRVVRGSGGADAALFGWPQPAEWDLHSSSNTAAGLLRKADEKQTSPAPVVFERCQWSCRMLLIGRRVGKKAQG